MTFEQIKKQESTYVNSCGIVFSAYPERDEISITYNIDDDTLMELIKPSRKLEAIFNTPDRVGIAELYECLHPCRMMSPLNAGQQHEPIHFKFKQI
jgi:hypothetical protein